MTKEEAEEAEKKKLMPAFKAERIKTKRKASSAFYHGSRTTVSKHIYLQGPKSFNVMYQKPPYPCP